MSRFGEREVGGDTIVVWVSESSKREARGGVVVI